MNTNVHFWTYLAQFILEWEIFHTKVVEKIKIHILCSLTIFLENRTFYEIMWENTVKPERPQMTIWHMRIACGYLRLRAHTIYNTYCCTNAPQCYVIRTSPVLPSVCMLQACLSCTNDPFFHTFLCSYSTCGGQPSLTDKYFPACDSSVLK